MGKTVAILAQGAMGAAVGRRLSDHGVTVLTCLAGRGAASRQRAAEAGMVDVAWDRLASADLFLSIVPPDAALATAHEVAPYLAAGGRAVPYADCNAVSPTSVRDVGAVVAAAGLPFIDAAIIGPPPVGAGTGTVFYACGRASDAFARLREFGLEITILDADIGAASALKMCYAGLSKGLTGLGAAMALAATRNGARDALLAELARSQPDILKLLVPRIPDMLPKAYRWAGEMDEIAAFVGADDPAAAIYEGLAKVYAALAQDLRAEGTAASALAEFVRPRA